MPLAVVAVGAVVARSVPRSMVRDSPHRSARHVAIVLVRRLDRGVEPLEPDAGDSPGGARSSMSDWPRSPGSSPTSSSTTGVGPGPCGRRCGRRRASRPWRCPTRSDADFNDDWRGIFTEPQLAGYRGRGRDSRRRQPRGRDRGVRRRRRDRLVVRARSDRRCSAAAVGRQGSRCWLRPGAAFVVVGVRAGGGRYGARVRRALLVAAVRRCARRRRGRRRRGLWGEPTFEQRRTIWGLVWDRIAERPLQGFGWFNVWTDADFVSEHDPLLGRGSAHGSFFEVWLGLGLIGVIPFLVIVGLALHGTITAAWRRPSVASRGRGSHWSCSCGREPDRELRAVVLLQLGVAHGRRAALRCRTALDSPSSRTPATSESVTV